MKKTLAITFIVMFLIAGLFVLTGCENKSEKSESTTIVGNWKNNDLNVDFIYTFNEDGTGKYAAGSTNMEFTYTVDGNKLSILYTGNTVPFETEYSINGDTLNVKDSLGSDTLYKKVK